MNKKNLVEIFSSSLYTIKNQGFVRSFRLIFEFFNLTFKPSYVMIKPSIIQIEPTIRCNLHCEMCDHSIWDRRCGDLTFKDFKKIIEQFPYLRTLIIQGMGEPFLNKEFFDMISYAKSKRIEVRTITNGTILNKDICKKTLMSGIDRIYISLDSANAKKYEKIRKGAKFDKVINNIRSLVKEKGNRKKPEIIITAVYTKENIHDIPNLINLTSELGLSKMNIQPAQTWGKDVWKKKLKNKSSIEDFEKIYDLSTKKAKKLGITLVHSLTGSCKFPWRFCYITADGFVTPCCLHGSDPRNLNFGNILKEDFNKIWNSKKYQNFRKSIKNKNIPNFCVGCPKI